MSDIVEAPTTPAAETPAPSNVTPIVRHNPLLDRFNKMPPETFRLPSGGVLYNNGEIDPEVTNGELILYPMTTVDEITIRSPDMLFQGTAITSVFSRCIPQVKKPLELLSNDVDFLLICLRIITYGNNLEIYWNCPKCSESDSKESEIDVKITREEPVSDVPPTTFDNIRQTYNVNLSKIVNDAAPLNYVNNPAFTLNVPTGEVVKLRPPTFKEMLKLYQYNTDKIDTPEEMVEFILNSILSVIESVDGDSNKDDIKEWGKRCKAPVLTYIQNKIQEVNNWGSNHEYEFICPKCKHVSTGEVPLNPISFFTTPSTYLTKV